MIPGFLSMDSPQRITIRDIKFIPIEDHSWLVHLRLRDRTVSTEVLTCDLRISSSVLAFRQTCVSSAVYGAGDNEPARGPGRLKSCGTAGKFGFPVRD
jgi:hypothetical protein